MLVFSFSPLVFIYLSTATLYIILFLNIFNFYLLEKEENAEIKEKTHQTNFMQFENTEKEARNNRGSHSAWFSPGSSFQTPITCL